MTKRTMVIATFAAVSLFIMVVAMAILFAGRVRIQVVGPLTAAAVMVNVFVLMRNFRAIGKEETPSGSLESNPTIALIRTVAIGLLLFTIVVSIAFVIQAHNGTLNPTDLYRTLPKAAYAVILSVVVLVKFRRGS